MARVVALLGGASTGKTTLATALQRHLQQVHGLHTLHVPEHRHRWQAAMGRAPTAPEHAAIADEQSRLIDAARQTPGVAVVVADTTALMPAVYNAQRFGDAGLLTAALVEQRRCDLSLLMGLDLPAAAGQADHDGARERAASDTLLRRTLQEAGMAFQTVYGQGEARLRQALRALGAAWQLPLVADDPALAQGLRPWSCENCSDPDCERRLFTGLLPRRAD